MTMMTITKFARESIKFHGVFGKTVTFHGNFAELICTVLDRNAPVLSPGQLHFSRRIITVNDERQPF